MLYMLIIQVRKTTQNVGPLCFSLHVQHQKVRRRQGVDTSCSSSIVGMGLGGNGSQELPLNVTVQPLKRSILLTMVMLK